MLFWVAISDGARLTRGVDPAPLARARASFHEKHA
jgi:hypothetical protein